MGTAEHISLPRALIEIAESVARFAALLVAGRIRQPRGHVGDRIAFDNGNSGLVFRETVIAGAHSDTPAVLVVEFRLRGVHGFGHRLFRAESLLNTPLFAGFPGLISKLWLTGGESEIYRGLYEWTDAARATSYARALYWPLALVAVRRSIGYRVIANRERAQFLAESAAVQQVSSERN